MFCIQLRRNYAGMSEGQKIFWGSISISGHNLPPSQPDWVMVNPKYGGALCVEMVFYSDISWESRYNIEIKSLRSFLQDIVSCWSTLSTLGQRDDWKKLKLLKVNKGCFKLNFFLWFTDWWNHLHEKYWLGIGKAIRETLKFYENEARL